MARRPSGTTDGGKTLDEPRTRRRAGRAPGTNADRSAEPLYRSERWEGIPVPRVDPNGFLFYPDAPGEFEELATAQECAAFARWMREAESASGLRTDEWFAAIAGKRPPDARELLSGEASLTGYQEFCLQLAIYLGLCPYPKEIMPELLKLVWGLRMHLTQLIPERIRGSGRAASTVPSLRPGGVVPPFEPPGLPEGPLSREALQEGLARARAAAAERMRLLAAVPGADTARELQFLAEWLYRHEAMLRTMAPLMPLTQEEIQEAFARNLVRLRTAAGLTQGQLAERSGVSQPQISQLERAAQEPRLPEGPLSREALREGLARARAAAAERMRLLAAVPGADTARELQFLAEWLYRHEAMLRAMAPLMPLTQEEIQEAFARNLVRLRTAAGLTQGQLAERSGVSQPQISQLERAVQEPRLSTVLALSRALGVEPAILLQGTTSLG